MTSLSEIGFYSMTDERALTSTSTSRLERCELLLTKRCNFRCTYCRGIGPPDATLDEAAAVVEAWQRDNCRNMRFSGGEPTLWPGLVDLVALARETAEHVAISTNGSADLELYRRLVDVGVNDFSISLDACCAATAGRMAGGKPPATIAHVMDVIRLLAPLTYTTIGTVVLPDNLDNIREIIDFGLDVGVADVRLISAAQWNKRLNLVVPREARERFPILDYRVKNAEAGRPMRGLRAGDCRTCRLAVDDMAVSGDYHYPCIIYLREGGDPIGHMSGPIRMSRARWISGHDSLADPICAENCLDVCIDYNNKAARRGR